VKGDGEQQDYGMRVYDPRLGRFLSVDPLAKKYPFYTAYSFAGNKPIKFIDLDGGEEKEKDEGFIFESMDWVVDQMLDYVKEQAEKELFGTTVNEVVGGILGVSEKAAGITLSTIGFLLKPANDYQEGWREDIGPPRFPELLKKLNEKMAIVNNIPVTPAPAKVAAKHQPKQPLKHRSNAQVPEMQSMPSIHVVLSEAKNEPANITTLKELQVVPPRATESNNGRSRKRGRLSEWFHKIKEHLTEHKFKGGGKRNGHERF
jgi:hypothetical protein